MNKVISAFLSVLGVVIFCVACKSLAAEKSPEIFENVQTEITMQAWQTKGWGKTIGSDTVTIVKSKALRGDVIILRWSEPEGHASVEVYRAVGEEDPVTSWELQSETRQKTLTHQHGEFYMIHELVPGENGGQRKEVFTLP